MMKAGFLEKVALVLLLILPGIPALAGGDFVGPASVEAAPDGSFDFDVLFIVDADGAAIEGWGLGDGLNTTVDEFDADGNCLEPLAGGESIVFDVEGSLDDPSLPGSTFATVHFCGDVSLIFETTILPSAQAVPTASEWGLIAMALLLVGSGVLIFSRLGLFGS